MQATRWAQLGIASLAVGLMAGACHEALDRDELGVARQALDAPIPEAYCDADVDDLGLIPTETDYLPQVIACENSGADLEALKAQAVAARSVLYWSMGTNGSICNSQTCQVYTCTNPTLPIHVQAVEETSGEYLAYNGNVTYGFYVNGDPNTAPPSCVGNPNAPNENWLTYNEGLTGTDVQQTPLGFEFDPADAEYGQNRGCQGQWGARCLEGLGYDYRGILEFYYGADIQILKASGPCVIPDPMGQGGAGVGGAGGGAGGDIGAGGLGSGASDDGGNPPAFFDGGAQDDGGCTIASAPAPHNALPAWLLAALALVLARRRG